MEWWRRQLDADFRPGMGGKGGVSERHGVPLGKLSNPGCRLIPGTTCENATGAVTAATSRALAGESMSYGTAGATRSHNPKTELRTTSEDPPTRLPQSWACRSFGWLSTQ